MNTAARWFALTIPLAVSLDAHPSFAFGSSFVCENGQRVKTGQHLTEVIQRCGDPDWTEQRMEQRRTKIKTGRRCHCHHQEITEERVVDILVDHWVYDFGVNHHVRHLRFENGFLVAIVARWNAAR